MKSDSAGNDAMQNSDSDSQISKEMMSDIVTDDDINSIPSEVITHSIGAEGIRCPRSGSLVLSGSSYTATLITLIVYEGDHADAPNEVSNEIPTRAFLKNCFIKVFFEFSAKLDTTYPRIQKKLFKFLFKNHF